MIPSPTSPNAMTTDCLIFPKANDTVSFIFSNASSVDPAASPIDRTSSANASALAAAGSRAVIALTFGNIFESASGFSLATLASNWRTPTIPLLRRVAVFNLNPNFSAASAASFAGDMNVDSTALIPVVEIWVLMPALVRLA